jgi:hypothetical protein
MDVRIGAQRSAFEQFGSSNKSFVYVQARAFHLQNLANVGSQTNTSFGRALLIDMKINYGFLNVDRVRAKFKIKAKGRDRKKRAS